jgi:hypothetical protein
MPLNGSVLIELSQLTLRSWDTQCLCVERLPPSSHPPLLYYRAACLQNSLNLFACEERGEGRWSCRQPTHAHTHTHTHTHTGQTHSHTHTHVHPCTQACTHAHTHTHRCRHAHDLGGMHGSQTCRTSPMNACHITRATFIISTCSNYCSPHRHFYCDGQSLYCDGPSLLL